MQRVPDSSAADGDRAVKKRNLSARTPPQAATGALAVAEDPHSDVADAFVDAQQLDHNVRRSTRPRTQRQKRELFHSVRVLGGSAALPSALAEAETRGDDSAWNGLSLRKAAAVCYELQSSTGSGSRLSLSAMADLFGLESKQSVNAWTKHKDFKHILKDDVFVEAAQAKFKELRDSAVAAAAAGKEKAAEQERGKLADLSHDKKIAAYRAVKKMKEKGTSVNKATKQLLSKHGIEANRSTVGRWMSPGATTPKRPGGRTALPIKNSTERSVKKY